MKREKCFAFTREGLEECFKHKDYIGTAIETIENHPEVLPVALLLALGVSTLLVNPLPSTVAYKTPVDTSIIAFKFLGGF